MYVCMYVCVYVYVCILYVCIFAFSALPSVLWHCWFGGRKGIRPVKSEWWGAGVVICLEHCHSPSLASVKSRLVLPFWYRLTQVVLEKGPLNGRMYACIRMWEWPFWRSLPSRTRSVDRPDRPWPPHTCRWWWPGTCWAGWRTRRTRTEWSRPDDLRPGR